MKEIINEVEFDRLPEQSQMKYLWCPECCMFYPLVNRGYHNCPHTMETIDEIFNDRLS